jgi:adenylate cyclase
MNALVISWTRTSRLRPTLRQVFGFSLIGLLLGLALVFYFVLNGSERTILQSAERYRDLASREVAARVTDYLNEAPLAIDQFEKQVRYNLIQPKNPDSVEPALLSLLLANDSISEATLTYADDTRGNIGANSASSGQVAVLRSPKGGAFVYKRTWFDNGRFVSQSTTWGNRTQSPGAALEPPGPAADPTAHPTFQTPLRPDFYGQLVWADLHWSQIDEGMPEAERRVEVSVQKTIENGQRKFAGVLRIGLVKSLIDQAVQQHLTAGNARDPHLIFLCDSAGRLITGFGDKNKVMASGDDLRIPGMDVPAVVARALQEPSLSKVADTAPSAASSFRFGNQDYLYTFMALPQTQEWIVGIVVPRDYYLGQLLTIRRQVLEVSALVMAAIILAGGLIVRNVVRSQALILDETAKMNEFEFAPALNKPWLRDIKEVLAGLEKAKTAMRAMSKYVPVNLVRQLYQDGREPELGGKVAELSMLFTDIQGFTSFSEQVSPGRLAEVLGLYLQAVTNAIQCEKGTIDKYIGDSVMALWNVPEETPGHEIMTCRAALRCQQALQELYDSPVWGDAPRFDTRLGLHRCLASVGHFGAPDRFSYTAIGDGVNLASRLEGLNRYYETTRIASEAIYERAKDHFEFRLLDRVAVKGKAQGITIYELIAEKMPDTGRPEFVAAYENAFESYQRAEFEAALETLRGQMDDGPSRTLARRCRQFLSSPPAEWNGVWIYDTK